MPRVGLIVGSADLPWTVSWEHIGNTQTEFGEASTQAELAQVGDCEVVKLARHGNPHRLAPHAVNYRANLSLMQSLGVQAVVALNTVGGISSAATTGAIVLPDQIIDYTWGRPQSFSADDAVRHIDFSQPYDAGLRKQLLAAAELASLPVVAGGVMGVTQGPRLESVAEIARMRRDTCAIVGMTGMPEAALARELEIPYASLSLVVNPAAGHDGDSVDMASIAAVAKQGMSSVAQILWIFLTEVFESVK